MNRPMDWARLTAPFRTMEDGGPFRDEGRDGRSPFQQDQDRILFSSSFRRMGKKTQVHPLADNDNVHTRLTHSIEVACVGRSLGVGVGNRISRELPDPSLSPIHLGEIVHAACLAHDIGNPPFGHAGEYAIQGWFREELPQELDKRLTSRQRADLQLFDGNAMGFRVLAQTEFYRFKGGMRLTHPVLAAMLKYPWDSLRAEETGKPKFSCFASEIEAMDGVGESLCMVRKGDHRWARHPLAFLVEAADDICYSVLDLEDAHELRILSFDEIHSVFGEFFRDSKRFDETMSKSSSNRSKVAWIRGTVINALVTAVVEAFVAPDNYARIMDGTLEEDLISLCDGRSRGLVAEAKRLGRERIYNHPRKVELEIGAYATLGALLKPFCSAALAVASNTPPSFRDERVLNLLGANRPPGGMDYYETLMCFVDYLGGMTDQYATHMAQQFLGRGGPGITGR